MEKLGVKRKIKSERIGKMELQGNNEEESKNGKREIIIQGRGVDKKEVKVRSSNREGGAQVKGEKQQNKV